MPQAIKIPAAKTAVDKEWEKLEKISEVHFTSFNGHMSFEKTLNGRKNTKKRSGCFPQ